MFNFFKLRVTYNESHPIRPTYTVVWNFRRKTNLGPAIFALSMSLNWLLVELGDGYFQRVNFR